MKVINNNEKNSYEGYITNVSEENFWNYVEDNLQFDEIEKLKKWVKNKKITELAVLKNLWVDEEDRGKGIGNDLLDEFLNTHCGDNIPVFLVCDTFQDQEKGFDLEEWYKKWEFETLPFKCVNGILMYRPV